MGRRYVKCWQYGSVLVVLLMMVGIFCGCGQGSGKNKVYRVGIFSGLDAFSEIAIGFKRKMEALGYLEGKNIVYDYQKMDAGAINEQKGIKKFIDDKVDLIFTFPTEATIAAKTMTAGTGIPVLFAMAGIEDTDLVESVHRPGGNISGVRYPGLELTAKRLEILHELMPAVKRVFITYDPQYPTVPAALDELHSVASVLGVTLVEEPVNTLSQLQDAYGRRTVSGRVDIDAILIMPEAFSRNPDAWALITLFAAEHQLPVAGASYQTALEGAVFGYSPDLIEMGGVAASMAHKIFTGTAISDIMVVTPGSRLWFNYTQAQKLGLTVSEGFLSRVDKIIR